MKLYSTTIEKITQNTYRIALDNGDVIFHIEFINDKGKVTDSITRTDDGIEIIDPILHEKIEKFIDEL